MNDSPREADWAAWMSAAIAGDEQAYRRFLEAVTPYLRGLARRRCEQFGAAPGDPEDIVQETLLAIHLKRSTWDSSRPIGPWISTIARHKLIDSLRRGGRRVNVPIDDVLDTLHAEPPAEGLELSEIEGLLGRLQERQREIVRAISVESLSARETAKRLGMTEGAVRVALHRALRSLAALYRSERN